MNKHNKEKFREVILVDVDLKEWNYFKSKLSVKELVKLISNIFFKTRRGCLFLSCLDKGMNCNAAFIYYQKPIKEISNMLDIHGWDIQFGKLA